MASTTFTTRALTAALFTLLAWAVNPFTTQAQLPDYLPTDGLVGWWPFNGNANDESGNGNDGTVNGATLVEDRVGASNSAYDFDGVNDRISISHDTSLNTPLMSVSAWCNVEGYSSQGQNQASFIICKELATQPRIWSLYAAPGNSGFGSELRINGSLLEFGAPFGFDLGSWMHATITYDGSQARFYVNGELQVTYTSIGALDVTTHDLSIGYLPTTDLNVYGYFFNGLIDDIAIYNRALAPEEITALYTGIPYAAPCADPTACNFEQEGECVFAEPNLDCAGNCLNDFNNNGVCDEDEVYGCTYAFACNYNPEATTDDGTCTVALANYDCAGNCLLDLNNNGLCDLEEVAGCTNIDAINYNPDASLDDGSCMTTCKGDFDNDGQITINDLLGFLAAYGNQCQGAGCMDPASCNYDPNATFDLDFCEYPLEFYACDGTPINDADGDGIPDELEVAGCTDPEAGNYNPDATDDDGSCTPAQPQYPAGSVFCNGTPTLVVEVLNPETGRIWMDRNLGASQAATSSTDEAAYGDLYQWGRGSDGHQCRNSATTSTLSGVDTPSQGNFILAPNAPNDWRSPQNTNLWQGVNGVNSPCPSGYRLPTETEINAERLSWSHNNRAGAFASPLKLPVAGHRNSPDGSLLDVGTVGSYWSSTVSSTNSRDLDFDSSIANMNTRNRADGGSVRCLKD